MKSESARQDNLSKRTLFTVSKFSEKHKDFLTEGGLRFQIFNANNNGLASFGAIIRVGRRVLIDEERYFNWVDNLRDVGNGDV